MQPVPVDESRPLRSNPDIFGEDAVRLFWKAFGLALTGFLNRKLVFPIVSRIIPANADPTGGKLTDAGSTAVTAWGVGEGAGIVSGPVGRDMKVGGLVLAAGKAIAAFVPGFSIDAQFPDVALPAVPSNVKQLPTANSTAQGAGASVPARRRIMGI